MAITMYDITEHIAAILKGSVSPGYGWEDRMAAAVVEELGLTREEQYLPNPRITRDPDGTLDDFYAENIDTVHFEALDNCQWYANVQLRNGQLWTLNFGALNSRARGYANAERIE